ncbi:hypothetical protein L210DRAFT_3420881, partial [Boletus edulis BED1]
RKSETANCPHCTEAPAPETVRHYLLECPNYARERQSLRNAMGREADSIPYLLSKPSALPHLFKLIDAARRLKNTFGNVPPPKTKA